MNATMDSYTQANILLSRTEAEQLKAQGELEGKVWRTTGETLPLRMRVSEKGWRAQGLPADVPYEEKTSYEIDIPQGGVEKIIEGKVIGTDMLTVNLRKLYMGLDTAF